MHSVISHLQQPVDGRLLGLFRLSFGAILVAHCLKLIKRAQTYSQAELHFPFTGFDWLPLLPSNVLIALAAVGSLAAVLWMLGVAFRLSGLALSLVMGYFIVIDQLYFNNHYYLFFLLVVLTSITDASMTFTVPGLVKRRILGIKVSQWQYRILQLQIIIVFFYGGLSKVSRDWLNQTITQPLASDLFGSGHLANFFSFVLAWGGMTFDLLIGFFLVFRPTRLIAIALVVFFNLSNHFLFSDISLFPWAMIIAVILLFGTDTRIESAILRGLRKLGLRFIVVKKSFRNKSSLYTSYYCLTALIIFFLFQLSFPLRHYFIPGHPEWTGQGHYFAWRMKSYVKAVDTEFWTADLNTGQKLYPINTGLDHNQTQRICAFPQMVLRLGKNIQDKLIAAQDSTHMVRVDYKVSLNGHGPQMAIDTNQNLADVNYHPYQSNQWILPFERR